MVIRAIESGIRMQTIAGTLGLSLEKCERSGRVQGRDGLSANSDNIAKENDGTSRAVKWRK